MQILVNKRSLLRISDNLLNVQNLVLEVRLYGVAEKELEFSPARVRETVNTLKHQFERLAISFHLELSETTVLLWGVHKTVFPVAPAKYRYTNLNQELIMSGMVKATESMTDIIQPEPLLRSHIDDIEPESQAETEIYNVNNEITDFTHWQPAERIDKAEFHAYPQYVSRNLYFYVLDDYRKCVVEKINIGIFEMLRNRVPDNTARRKPYTEWRIGDACFAPFDRSYYRATIKRIYSAERICSVCMLGSS